MILKSLLIFVFFSVLFFGCSQSYLLMEVSFDLALQQESETGYTASQAVGDFLVDQNLLWLRYLSPLVSGAPGSTPMRTALMAFNDFSGWAEFEQTNIERTHVLYDLFWINWRRILWKSDDTFSMQGAQRTTDTKGGYVIVFRYAPMEGKSVETAAFMTSRLFAVQRDIEYNGGFMERRHFSATLWQDIYTDMVWYEFSSLDTLSKNFVEHAALMTALSEAKDKYLARFSTTILVPGTGDIAGHIFYGPTLGGNK
jgi:hypothetical protein